jgi:hypothetical protein
MEQLDWQWNDFHQIRYSSIFRITAREYSDLIKTGKEKNGTLHEDQCTFLMICRSVLPIMGNISENVEKNKNTFCVQYFFPPENSGFYEIIWKVWYGPTGNK